MRRKDIATGQTYEWKRGSYSPQVVTVVAATDDEVDTLIKERTAANPNFRYQNGIRFSGSYVAINDMASRLRFVPPGQITRPITVEEYNENQRKERERIATEAEQRKERNAAYEAQYRPLVEQVNAHLGAALFTIGTEYPYGTNGLKAVDLRNLSTSQLEEVLVRIAELIEKEEARS